MRSPFWFWLSAWCTVIALTLYGAQDLQAMLLETPWLGERAWVVRASEKTMAIAETLGLAALHERVEALRSEPIAPDPETVALAENAPPAPPPPLPPLLPAASGDPASTSARRVLLLGASSMQFSLGVELERLLSQRPGITVERHGKASTGLARSDRMDWPARAEAWIAEFQPDLVITNFGGNDAQGMTLPGATPYAHTVAAFASREWDQAYGKQVARIAEAAQRYGSRIVMLGMPVMRQASFSARIAHVNEVTRAVIEAKGGLYLSTWELASDAAGNYQKSITWNGKTGPMRAPDGHHYTPLGGSYVASRIADELEQRGFLPPVTKP